MKAILWKELREHYKWAVLAMGLLGGAEYFALTYSEYGFIDYYSGSGHTLCREIFLTVTTFGCLLVGLLLGLVQILPELKRDQWAGLIHRPVPVGKIFWGKALAGMLLYLGATVPPFLFCVWYVATPGNFVVPFVPAMMKPGVADILAGAMFYLAALGTGLQRGPWFGLRLLPLLAAIHAIYFVHESSLFYVAVEAVILMAAALLIAAWGMMHHRDRVAGRPWAGRLAFLAVAFYGICGLGDVSKSLVGALFPNPPHTWERYELSEEGTPLRLTYVEGVVASVRGLDGKELTDPRYHPDRVRNRIKSLNTFSSYIGDSHGWNPRTYPSPYRESRSYLWTDTHYQYPRPELWFYLVESRCFIGYQPAGKKAVGFLGARGFQPASDQPIGFDAAVHLNTAGGDGCYIAGADGVRFADFPKQELKDCPVPEPGPNYGMSGAWAQGEQSTLSVVGVTFRQAMGIYDTEGQLLHTVPYRRDVARWGSIEMGLNLKGDRFYLWYKPSRWIDVKTRNTMESYLDEVDTEGKVLRSQVVPPLPDFPRQASFSSALYKKLRTPVFFFGTLLYQKTGGAVGVKRLQEEYTRRVGPAAKDTWGQALWIGAISAGLAGGAFFWGRRNQMPFRTALGWSIFVLAFNLAGFLVFRLLAEWPCLVPCGSCAGSRPVKADSCPNCGQNWPAPLLNGTEILDRPVGSGARVETI